MQHILHPTFLFASLALFSIAHGGSAITRESMEDDEQEEMAMINHAYKYHRPMNQVDKPSGNPWITGPYKKKYQFNVGHQSWLTAREHCLAQNADLVSIHSKEELEWILSHYQPNFEQSRERQVQVGLLLDSPERHKMHGGHHISHMSRIWHWISTGRPLDTSILQWTSGEPFDHSLGKERCAILNVHERKLDDIDCDLPGAPARLYRYVCERSEAQHHKHEEQNNPLWKKLEQILAFFGITPPEPNENASNQSIAAIVNQTLESGELAMLSAIMGSEAPTVGNSSRVAETGISSKSNDSNPKPVRNEPSAQRDQTAGNNSAPAKARASPTVVSNSPSPIVKSKPIADKVEVDRVLIKDGWHAAAAKDGKNEQAASKASNDMPTGGEGNTKGSAPKKEGGGQELGVSDDMAIAILSQASGSNLTSVTIVASANASESQQQQEPSKKKGADASAPPKWHYGQNVGSGIGHIEQLSTRIADPPPTFGALLGMISRMMVPLSIGGRAGTGAGTANAARDENDKGKVANQDSVDSVKAASKVAEAIAKVNSSAQISKPSPSSNSPPSTKSKDPLGELADSLEGVAAGPMIGGGNITQASATKQQKDENGSKSANQREAMDAMVQQEKRIQSKIRNLERIIGAVQKMIRSDEQQEDNGGVGGPAKKENTEQNSPKAAPLSDSASAKQPPAADSSAATQGNTGSSAKAGPANNSSSSSGGIKFDDGGDGKKATSTNVVGIDSSNGTASNSPPGGVDPAIAKMESDFIDAENGNNRLRPNVNSGDVVELSHRHDEELCGDSDADADDSVVEPTINATQHRDEKLDRVEKFIHTLKEFLSTHNGTSSTAELKALLEKRGKGAGGEMGVGESLIERLEKAVEAERQKNHPASGSAKEESAQLASRESTAIAASNQAKEKAVENRPSMDNLPQKPKENANGSSASLEISPADKQGNATNTPTTPNNNEEKNQTKLLEKASVKQHHPQSPFENIIDVAIGLAHNISKSSLKIHPNADGKAGQAPIGINQTSQSSQTLQKNHPASGSAKEESAPPSKESTAIAASNPAKEKAVENRPSSKDNLPHKPQEDANGSSASIISPADKQDNATKTPTTPNNDGGKNQTELLEKASAKQHHPQSPFENIIDVAIGLAHNISKSSLKIHPNAASAAGQASIEVNQTSQASPSPLPSGGASQQRVSSVIPEAEEADNIIGSASSHKEAQPGAAISQSAGNGSSSAPTSASNFTVPDEVVERLRAEKERVDLVYANFTAAAGKTSAIDALIERVGGSKVEVAPKSKDATVAVVEGDTAGGVGSGKMVNAAAKHVTKQSEASNTEASKQNSPGANRGNTAKSIAAATAEGAHGLMIKKWEEAVERYNKGVAAKEKSNAAVPA